MIHTYMPAETSFIPPQDPRDNRKVYISWKQVSEYTMQVNKYLLSVNFLPDAIISPHKGGLIPGAILSYHLKTSELYTIKVVDNDIIYPKDITNISRKNILIIDNLIEKGEKVYYMSKFLKDTIQARNIMIVSLVQKRTEEPHIIPNFAVRTIKQEHWAVFPWEELNY